MSTIDRIVEALANVIGAPVTAVYDPYRRLVEFRHKDDTLLCAVTKESLEDMDEAAVITMLVDMVR